MNRIQSLSIQPRSWRHGVAISAPTLDPNAIEVETMETLLKVVPADGHEVAAPLQWIPRPRDATPEQRRNSRLIGGGQGIHWPDMDEDIAVSTLLRAH